MRFVRLFLCLLLIHNTVLEKVTFINVEHPRVTYINPAFIKYANLTATRYSRANPIYFVGLHFENIVPINSSYLVDIYLYELLTNVYKPSFIEFHYDWCHLVEKDMFFGAAMRQGKLHNPCPYGPGAYHLVNMTINPKIIPKGFPFTQGRIYANITQGKMNIRVAEGYIDMKIGRYEKKIINQNRN